MIPPHRARYHRLSHLIPLRVIRSLVRNILRVHPDLPQLLLETVLDPGEFLHLVRPALVHKINPLREIVIHHADDIRVILVPLVRGLSVGIFVASPATVRVHGGSVLNVVGVLIQAQFVPHSFIDDVIK